MTTHTTTEAAGSIIVTDPDQDFLSLNVPGANSDETVSLVIADMEKPRKIQMSDLPSAAVVTLLGDDWTLELKTTHAPAHLNNQDVDYFFKTYSEGNFIKEGLGIQVQKKTGSATRDSLKIVRVTTSA